MLWATWKIAGALVVVFFAISIIRTLNVFSLYCTHIDSQCEPFKGEKSLMKFYFFEKKKHISV